MSCNGSDLFVFGPSCLAAAHCGMHFVKVQEAKILWAQGQQQMAVNLLKYVISNHNVQDNSGSVHCLTGKWLAETRSDRYIRLHSLFPFPFLCLQLENKFCFCVVLE